MTILAWCCGAGLVTAAALMSSGLRGGSSPMWRRPRSVATAPPPHMMLRLVMAGGGALLFGVITRWPVASAAGAMLGFFAPELLAPRAARHAPIEKTEAIAAWTEQLRDTMAAAAGLQQAISATVTLAPQTIRAEVCGLAAASSRGPLVTALRGFAEELADPTGDLVVAALVLAASGEAQDLGPVLSEVAASARQDATMRRFVDASRARTRTAVRVITAIAIVTLTALLVVGHGYLRPYGRPQGQVVLAAVLACYAAGVALLHRMAREKPVERILSPPLRSSPSTTARNRSSFGGAQ